MLRILSQALPEFGHVLYIHDQTSDQNFFVNTTLLRKSYEDAYILREGETEENMRLTSDDWIDCVGLETPPVLMTQQPKLRQIWDHIVGNLILNPSIAVIQIPSDLTFGREHLLIPLAAFLLEYPVGYVPLNADQSTFLSNTPLDVYECVLEESGEEHTLLKFSCPQCVSQSVARLAPDEVQRRLANRFQPRLEAVDYPGRLEILHTQENLPRVGL
ncbi:hypothetical protein BDM02DRAFT_3119732 [Thelephora ganbajun]|uniref:Uncharacterized protein n=1 Tax=Thelephora ganbajun TaxID=370292 RepID=A0ACB6Z7X5_THEGA|nr:hypothetical protein BDM02DRAFT_3119732 [Thelephora ganbajun]